MARSFRQISSVEPTGQKHITVQALCRPHPRQAISDAHMLANAMLLIASSPSAGPDLPTPLCQCNCAPHLHATAAAAQQIEGQPTLAALQKGMIQ